MPQPTRPIPRPDWRQAFLALLDSQGVSYRAFPHRRWLVVQDFAMVLVWVTAAYLVLMAWVASRQLFEILPVSEDGRDILHASLIIPVGLVIWFGLAPRWQAWGRRATMDVWTGRDAAEAIKRAKRAPVLYLRSFGLDDAAARVSNIQHLMTLFGGVQMETPESYMVLTAARWAPVIAVGRPGEPEAPLGATRIYLAQEVWEAKVLALIEICQLVIWASGHTEGLHWEIRRLVNSVPPNRLVLWFHPDVIDAAGESAEQRWTRFAKTYGYLFPKPLPVEAGKMQSMAFRDDWTPIIFPAPGRFGNWFFQMRKFMKQRLT